MRLTLSFHAGKGHSLRQTGRVEEIRRGRRIYVARKNYLFTSESVSEGHPDKVCDRISDEIVDAFFREGAKAGIDPYAIRVAAETLCTTNRVVIAGEVRGPNLAFEHVEDIAREAIKAIGYEQDGFHWKHAKVEVLLHAQSADIAQGVDAAGNKDEGAGDQGIMFGYAVRETPELMPAPLYYAHKILEDLAKARHSGKEKGLGPDAKSQVTLRYENGKPVEATQIVLSHQHTDESLSPQDVREHRRALYPRSSAGGFRDRRRRSGTSIRPASSSSAARTATPASRAARSSSTPMAARRRMAAAPSPARTRPRSTARRPMPRAISPRTSSRRASPIARRSSSPMRSASPSRCRSMSICTARARSPRTRSRRCCRRSCGSRRAASASISSSTSRSTRAPRPMATSAASPTLTAASPGRRPTSSTR